MCWCRVLPDLSYTLYFLKCLQYPPPQKKIMLGFLLPRIKIKQENLCCVIHGDDSTSFHLACMPDSNTTAHNHVLGRLTNISTLTLSPGLVADDDHGDWWQCLMLWVMSTVKQNLKVLLSTLN